METQRQLRRQKSTLAWILVKKSTTLKLSAQLAGRSIAVLTTHVTSEREGLGASAKFQKLPASSAASLYYGLFHFKTF